MREELRENCIQILKEELMPALGCTEPIALAYAAAKAREVLGTMPESATVFCSGNIVKNVKSVTVPNSNGLRGIEAAATLGIVGGRADKQLEVLNEVTQADIEETKKLLKSNFCGTELATGVDKLYIRVETKAGEQTSSVTIQGHHTNITDVIKNGEVLLHVDFESNSGGARKGDREAITIANILEFANGVDVADIEPILSRQIEYNSAIGQEGLTNPYGASVSKTLLSYVGEGEFTMARAKAVAASEARMAGCALPVVINSGSGNQGITVSVPVIEFAAYHNLPKDKLYRALAVSNLVSIHMKHYIGDLSAFCGAVTAACGAGAALAYLDTNDLQVVVDTINNTMATTSGIFCDGAKPSCAAKVSASLEAAYLAFRMAKEKRAFLAGEGVVGYDVESTIHHIGYIAREGMEITDQEILKVMLKNVEP